jgi:hypothetical protein
MNATVVFEGKQYNLEYEVLGPSIYVYRNAIPKEMRIIERVENALAIPNTRFQWSPAQLGFGTRETSWRNCADWKIAEETLAPRDEFSSDIMNLHSDIITSLKISLEHYKPENYLAEISYFEAINIVKYGKGEYFKVHTDDGDPYRCTVSCVGYVNDDYEGGEITFPKFNIVYKPKAGDFVIFPSAYAYAHSSEPVLDDGTKYSLVIMTDRNKFANRKDSAVHYDPDFLRQNGYQIHGMNKRDPQK